MGGRLSGEMGDGAAMVRTRALGTAVPYWPAITSIRRSRSLSFEPIPTEALMAPIACAPPHALILRAKLARLHPSRLVSAMHSAVRSAENPNAASDAPGLQKHPPRTDTPARRACSSTSSYDNASPHTSSTLNVTVPP